jgi:hypothetical protein
MLKLEFFAALAADSTQHQLTPRHFQQGEGILTVLLLTIVPNLKTKCTPDHDQQEAWP